MNKEFEKIKEGIDILVITPDRLERHRHFKKLFLSLCETLIIDEYDTLLDSGYDDYLNKLITPLVDSPMTQENTVERKVNTQIIFS